MAEMEAAKAGKPKSTNPAGVEHPSAPGSRDKLGERPLVEGIDKQEPGTPEHYRAEAEMREKYNLSPKRTHSEISGGRGVVAGIQDKVAGKGGYMSPPVGYRAGRAAAAPAAAARNIGGAVKRSLGNVEAPEGYTGVGSKKGQFDKAGPFTKSVDLEDGSRSWDYQG